MSNTIFIYSFLKSSYKNIFIFLIYKVTFSIKLEQKFISDMDEIIEVKFKEIRCIKNKKYKMSK